MSKQSVILEELKNLSQVTSTKTIVNEEVDYDALEKEIKNNPAHKRLEKLCSMYGYGFDMAYIRFSGRYYKLVFTPYVKDNTNKYLREIYVEPVTIGKDIKTATKVTVKGMTTSFGALSKEEFSKYNKAVDDMNNLIFALSSFDYSKLTVAEVDDII